MLSLRGQCAWVDMRCVHSARNVGLLLVHALQATVKITDAIYLNIRGDHHSVKSAEPLLEGFCWQLKQNIGTIAGDEFWKLLQPLVGACCAFGALEVHSCSCCIAACHFTQCASRVAVLGRLVSVSVQYLASSESCYGCLNSGFAFTNSCL